MKRLAIGLSTFLLVLGAAPAHAEVITYTTPLSGLSEATPNESPGTGQATVTINDVANTMRINVTFSGLLSPVTMAHIHCCTADPLDGTVGVATALPSFPGFPAGVLSGTYSRRFDLLASATYNPAFVTANLGITGARDALLAGIASGRSYLNIHTVQFGGGEIRGFLVEETSEVPEPGSMALFALGAAGLSLWRRRGLTTRR